MKIDKIQKINFIMCWQGCGETGTLFTDYQRKYKTVYNQFRKE